MCIQHVYSLQACIVPQGYPMTMDVTLTTAWLRSATLCFCAFNGVIRKPPVIKLTIIYNTGVIKIIKITTITTTPCPALAGHGGALVEEITLNRRVVGSTPALA